MSKKKIALAVLAATAAMMLPAPALAAEWGHNATPLKANATIGLTGTMKFTTQSGGIVECQVTFAAVMKPGFQGEIESMAVDNGTVTEKCKTGGNLAKCQVHQFQGTGFPWSMQLGEPNISVAAKEIHVSLTGAPGECPITNFSTTPGTITMISSAHQFSTLGLSGTLKHHVLGAGEAQLSVSGSLSVESPNSATYEVLFESRSWTHNHVPLIENKQIGLTGSLQLATATGAIQCQLTYALQLQGGGSTGSIQSMVPDNGTVGEKCKGAGGYAFCQLSKLEPVGLPWTVHASATPSIAITMGQVNVAMSGFLCPTTFTLTPHTQNAAPDNAATIGALTFSSSAPADVGGAATTTTVTGALSVEAPNAGTFGIS